MQALFQSIEVPEEVASELSAPVAPDEVRRWVQNPPKWLRVSNQIPEEMGQPPEVSTLDSGERAAILLGLARKADLILIDERKGTSIATSLRLKSIGTLGVLDLAARQNLVNQRTQSVD